MDFSMLIFMMEKNIFGVGRLLKIIKVIQTQTKKREV